MEPENKIEFDSFAGNPAYEEPELENGEQDANDQQRWFEQEAENYLFEMERNLY